MLWINKVWWCFPSDNRITEVTQCLCIIVEMVKTLVVFRTSYSKHRINRHEIMKYEGDNNIPNNETSLVDLSNSTIPDYSRLRSLPPSMRSYFVPNTTSEEEFFFERTTPSAKYHQQEIPYLKEELHEDYYHEEGYPVTHASPYGVQDGRSPGFCDTTQESFVRDERWDNPAHNADKVRIFSFYRI